MNIQIGKVSLMSDGTQYTVGIVKQRDKDHPEGKWKEGDYYQDVIGHYGMFEHALEGIVEQNLKNSDALTIEQLKGELVLLHNTIASLKPDVK